jgi:DNA-binding PucR family transcriptional regulator
VARSYAAQPSASTASSALDRLKTLLDTSRALGSELTLSEIICNVLEGAIRVIPAADAGVLFLYDKDCGGLVANHSIGFGPSIYDIVVKPGEGLSGKAYLSKRPQMYGDRDAVVQCMTDTQPENLERMRLASAGRIYAQSALTCPLVYKGEPIGALVVENLDSPEVFEVFDLELLEGFARAAAIALANARLFEAEREARLKVEALNEDVRHRNDELGRQLEIQRAFAEIIREGHDLTVLASRLGAISDASVVIVDSMARVRAAAPPLSAATASRALADVWPQAAAALRKAELTRSQHYLRLPDGELLITPIVAALDVLGAILLKPVGRPVTATDHSQCDAAAVVAAAEFLRERALYEAELHRDGDTVEELLSGRWPLVGRRRIQLPVALAVGELNTADSATASSQSARLRLFATVRDAFSQGGVTAVFALRGNQLVLVASSISPDALQARLGTVREQLARLPDRWETVFAVSDAVDAQEAVKDAYHELVAALAVRRQLQRSQPVFRVSGLRAYRLILRAATEADTLAICSVILEKVLPADTRSGSKILATLRTYFEHGYSVRQTARALGVHPHTVSYRLERLEELTGLQISKFEDRLTLELAVRIMDAANSAG